MRLHLTTPPAVEPVTLAEAKLHRRVDDTADDALITELISAARQVFEGETGRQCVNATWRLYLVAFPRGRQPIRVPKPPLVSVDSVTYVDTAGATQTWDSDEYQVDSLDGPFAKPGLLYPQPLKLYPLTYPTVGAVQVDFTAGYGATASEVPESVKAVIKEMVGDLYEQREGVITGTFVGANPSFSRMLHRFRVPVYA